MFTFDLINETFRPGRKLEWFGAKAAPGTRHEKVSLFWWMNFLQKVAARGRVTYIYWSSRSFRLTVHSKHPITVQRLGGSDGAFISHIGTGGSSVGNLCFRGLFVNILFCYFPKSNACPTLILRGKRRRKFELFILDRSLNNFCYWKQLFCCQMPQEEIQSMLLIKNYLNLEWTTWILQ